MLTADGGTGGGLAVGLKANVDAAVAESPCVEHVVVARRIGRRRGVAPA